MSNLLGSRAISGTIHRLISPGTLGSILITGLLASILTIPHADAATVTIETSADALGGTFFGGIVQIIVEDTSTDDQNDDTIDVTIDLSSSDGDTSQTITVPNTSAGSQRFEFFIVHVDALDQTPDDPVSNTLLSDDQILLFGSGAGLDELEVTGLELFDEATFDISVGSEEIAIDYEESTATLELDRSTYGSDSIVHMMIIDQDGNLDPTTSEFYSITDAGLAQLFDITGADFDGSATFEETGDNTARFEATLQLASMTTGADDELVFTSDAVQVTLSDMANYLDDLFENPENDSLDTSSRSFDVEDNDGELEEVTSLTFASELKLNLNDNDRNRDSDDDETLDDVVIVRVEDGDANDDEILDAGEADEELLDMEETDDNTGIFVIDLSNNELPVTFLADNEDPVIGNSILELRGGEITDDIVIEYNDTHDDDSLISITSSQTIEISLATGTLELPDSGGFDDEFLMTLTDGDLNNNARTKDSYTFVLNEGPPYPLSRGGDNLGDLADFEFEVEGEPTDFGSADIAYTLVETDINSGVFLVELDMGDIVSLGNNGAPLDVDDGDILRITYNDHMDEVTRESSDDIAIGKAGLPDGDFICMGLIATIVGTEGPDVINGTNGADVIVGLRGDDVINGLGGDDVICGELGLDQLSGGDGNDMLFGGNANDVLSGDGGSDMLWGGTGWDRLAGGIGNDTLRGGIGNDRLAGGDGDDKLFGQEGLDRLDGGAGSNQLVQD